MMSYELAIKLTTFPQKRGLYDKRDYRQLNRNNRDHGRQSRVRILLPVGLCRDRRVKGGRLVMHSKEANNIIKREVKP